MDEEQAQAILDSAKAQFKQLEFSEMDINIALVILGDLLGLFNKPYICKLTSNIDILSEWPIADPKFPEVLRVLANIFELMIKENELKK